MDNKPDVAFFFAKWPGIYVHFEYLNVSKLSDSINMTREWAAVHRAHEYLGEFFRNQVTVFEPFCLVTVVVCCFCFLLSLIGNLLVFYVTGRHLRKRKATASINGVRNRVFMCGLSVADILVALFCMPWTIGQHIYYPWIYTEFLCRVSNFVQGATMAASIWIVAVICIDRAFLTQRHGLRCFQHRLFRPTLVIVYVYIVSALMYAPLLSVTRLHNVPIRINENTTYHRLVYIDYYKCIEKWEHNYNRLMYDLFLFVGIFIIPGIIFIATYYKLSKVLVRGSGQMARRMNSAGGRESFHKNIANPRRKIVRLMTVVAVLFWVCLLPYHIIQIYLDIHDDVQHSDILNNTVTALIVFRYFTTVAHPILYKSIDFEKDMGLNWKQLCHCTNEGRSDSRVEAVSATGPLVRCATLSTKNSRLSSRSSSRSCNRSPDSKTKSPAITDQKNGAEGHSFLYIPSSQRQSLQKRNNTDWELITEGRLAKVRCDAAVDIPMVHCVTDDTHICTDEAHNCILVTDDAHKHP